MTLDVFLTVDVEIWCDGWDDLDRKFPDAFQRYIHGYTPTGDYGLAYTLRQLADHDLIGVFFVEPLFAARFGLDPLAEIIQLIKSYGHEVQLHLHTEWVDEAIEPLISDNGRKRQLLRCFTLEEQRLLIAAGASMIERSGGGRVNAFRAGSFGLNEDTLRALATNGIRIDSSYNAAMFGLDSGIGSRIPVVEPMECESVYEYPVTVFRDGTRALRPVQITACSCLEMEGLLWQALERRRHSFVIVSHNFELLNRAKNNRDHVAVKRFSWLCRFLDANRESFRVRGFRNLQPTAVASQPPLLVSPLWKTGFRMLEQAWRRRYA